MLLSEWSGFLKNASGCVQRKRTGGGKAAAELREVMGPNHSGLRSSPEASCTVRTAWISGPAGWERTGQSPKDKGTLHQLPVSVNDVNPQRLALTTGPAEPRASLPSPSVPRRAGCTWGGASDAWSRGAVRTASSSEPPRSGHVSSARDVYPASYQGEPMSGMSGLAFSRIHAPALPVLWA